MHFTVERHRLLAMANGARVGTEGPGQREGKVLVWACAARGFLMVNSTVAGEEALVLRDGGCQILLRDLLDLLKFYARKPNVTFQADADGARLEKAELRSWNYTATIEPPGKFMVGRVVDLPVVGKAGVGASLPGRI